MYWGISLPKVEVSEDSSSVSGSEKSKGSNSTSDHTTTNRTGESASSKESLMHQETKAVNRSKIVVYVCIVLAAAAVGVATYFLMHNAEIQDFHQAFYAYSKEIAEVSDSHAHVIFGQIHTLSTAMTSYRKGTNATFPTVTLPHFDIRAREAEELAGVELILYAPIVTEAMTSRWESYAWESQVYLQTDLALLPKEDQNFSPGLISEKVYSYEKGMFDDHGDEDGHDHADHEHRALSMHELASFDEQFTAPVWQMGPMPRDASIINLDLYSHPSFHQMMHDVLEIDHELLSGVTDMNFLIQAAYPEYVDDGHPRSFILQPVYDTFKLPHVTAGFIIGELPWENFFVDILPTGTPDMIIEIDGTCGASFTYDIIGHEVKYLGMGHLHDSRYDGVKYEFEFAEWARYDKPEEDELNGNHCEYRATVYASDNFEQSYYTENPAIFTAVVIMVFLITALIFATYDWMVARRQHKLQSTAERTNAIVSSLFPKDVQERIMAEAEEQVQAEQNAKKRGFRDSNKNQLKDFLDEDEGGLTEGKVIFKTKPIADLFPSVTVMFADLVGFTAWSSMREPCQVFTLLETIYHEFDQIAKRRRVFKVETVGDCYVAVAGLPEPRKDHATVMARFARDCLYKMHSLLKMLEISLGPDTADLGLRFGLHSGPVTAGVLRGERARFQLFGDTVNTTARIETTGMKNRIHISSEMAELLTNSGKQHWVRAREDKVQAKGKGEMSTYWLELRGDAAKSHSSAASSESGASESGGNDALKSLKEDMIGDGQTKDAGSAMTEKQMRLVDWNTEVIGKLLREVVARREASSVKPTPDSELALIEDETMSKDTIVLEEAADIIQLPKFDAKAAAKQKNASSVKLGDNVVSQLHDYIQTVAAMYRDNPFHNFEHASHVTMSVVKLLSRIVAPDLQTDNEDDVAKNLHDHTYGITSDPLTQFAVVISALIHDVDHTGVPNSQLIKEAAGIATVYKNKSIAEQNSVDIAWDLLQQDIFHDLRRTIYSTSEEYHRFRQLIVNSVMATDIMDKELSQARKARWNIAFAESADEDISKRDIVDRKATIVIEHLIQASDVVHTMQHWHIYRKWNTRLFTELMKAYKEGRSETDPSENWYKGEIGFFDFYVIPLAKKLKDCGVFGVSSDEYLTYALNNRREWEAKGQQAVEEMVEKFSTE